MNYNINYMNYNFDKTGQQLIRLEKLNSDDFYLLDKIEEDNKFHFDICGSTKNIYKVRIYFKSKMIYCNCPDAKSWAKKYGVICKHSCFVLFKVLKLNINKDEYLRTLIFNDQQMDYLKDSFKKINMTNSNEDFINSEYSEKFKNLEKNNNKNNDINPRESDENFCAICYEDFENIIDKESNRQCKVCMKILHKKCLNKWLSMGNHNCPYCRSIINNENNKYTNLFF